MAAAGEGTDAGAPSRTSSQRSTSGKLDAPHTPHVRSRASSNASSAPPALTDTQDCDMICQACGEPIDDTRTDEGAVRMSECFWHVACFTCITCGRRVPLDQDNVLLVGTQPMCGQCTFNCCACNEVIIDEVIMCDQDPYHTHCFRCTYCQRPIESNVFAKGPGTLACVACQDKMADTELSVSPDPEQARVRSLGSDSTTESSQSRRSAQRSSLVSAYSSHHSPKTSDAHLADLQQVPVDEPGWRRMSTTTDASSFELAYDRLSEMIQMEIVQAYYGSHSRSDTPMRSFDEPRRISSPSLHARRSKESLSNLRRQLAQRASFNAEAPATNGRDALHRPLSATESEIMRSLSMYDSEFEALLATPDHARRASTWSERAGERRSRASIEVADQIARDIASARDPDHDEPDHPLSSPTVVRSHEGGWRETDPEVSVLPDEAPAQPLAERVAPDEDTLQMKRRMALAELLAIEDARAPPGATEGESTSIRSRVELVLHSLMAHLDAVKHEYALEIQELIAQQQLLRHELRPMMQLRAGLHQENQRLAARADELNALVARLETQSRQVHAHKPLPEERDTSQHAPVTHAAARERAAPPIRETPSGDPTQPATNARLDASLPPLPEPRKFRWMKPRLLSNQDLATLGESLLQPAFEVKRATSIISPPVPPKGAHASPNPGDVVRAQNHVFQSASVLRPSARCFVCTRNVWGQLEMRCNLCHQVCHNHCIAHISSVCPAAPVQPSSAAPSPRPVHSRTSSSTSVSMVGRSLQEQVQLEGQPVPRLIDWCLAAIERNGLSDEGLYRKSGGIQQQRTIVQLFDSGQPFDLCDVRQFNDLGAITSVLKHYLRELPVPLIPGDLHEHYLEFGERLAGAPPATALPAMRRLLEQLPPAHRATLQRLCLHLKLVDQHSSNTRMSARNLALVFGRTCPC